MPRSLTRKKIPRSAIEWLSVRWWQRLIMWLFWPMMLLGTIYVGVFFFLNSSAFARLVEAQLNAATMGQWEVGDVSVDPMLRELHVTRADLDTPEGEHVITAHDITAPMPWFSVYELIDGNHLALHDIEVAQADVVLDFRNDGPFNLLRALAPPDPDPDAPPSDFSLALHSVDVYDAHVLLAFDGFSIDLRGADVVRYNLRVGGALEMHSTPVPGGKPGVTVERGTVTFEPRMFTFPLGEYGAPENGLFGDGGAGTVGSMARATHLAARAMHNACVEAGEDASDAECSDISRMAARGPLDIEVANAEVRNFWWDDSTFGFTRFETDIVEARSEQEPDGLETVGHIVLHQPDWPRWNDGLRAMPPDAPWMNVGPTAEDIAEAASRYGHTPTGTRPDDTILYNAPGEVELAVGSDVARWFFGDLIGPGADPDGRLHLQAHVTGDLGRAEGILNAEVEQLVAGPVEVSDVRLIGQLEGQRLQLVDVGADTLAGTVSAVGEYLIVDGDFDLTATLGTRAVANDDDTAEAWERGIDPGQLVDDDALRQYLGGTLTGQVRVFQDGHTLAVDVLDPLRLVLDEALPYSGAKVVELVQLGTDQREQEPPAERQRLLTLRNRILTVDSGLRVEVGRDEVVLAPGLRYALDAGTFRNLDIDAVVGDVAPYLQLLGVNGHSERVTLSAQASGTLRSPDVDLRLAVRGASVEGIDVPKLDLEAGHRRGRIDVERLVANTSLGELEVSGWIDALSRRDITTPRESMPLSLLVDARNIRLGAIPWLEPYGVAGTVALEQVAVEGRTSALRVDGQIEASDLEGYGERVPYLRSRVQLDLGRGQIGVSNFEASFGEQRERDGKLSRTTLRVADASFGFWDGEYSFEQLHLEPLYFEDVGLLSGIVPDLGGALEIKGSGSGDLDAFRGRTTGTPTQIEADIDLYGLEWGERAIGALDLSLTTPETSVVSIDGALRLPRGKRLDIDAQANLETIEAEARIHLDRAQLLDLSPELATAINGSPTAHLSQFSTEPPLVSAILATGDVTATYDRTGGFQASISLSKLAGIVKDESIVNQGPIEIDYRHDSTRLRIRRMELANNDKSIMLYGSADASGTVDVEVTGELSAALAKLAGEAVGEAKGSLALSLTGRGDVIDDEGNFVPGGLDVDGFVAVREPLEMRVRGLGGDLLRVESGVVYVADAARCPRSGETCFLIPVDKAFKGQVLGGTFALSGEIGRREIVVPTGAELLATADNLSFRVKDALTVTFDVPELRLFVLDLSDLELVPPQLYGAVEITEGRYYQDHLVQSEIFEQQIGQLTRADRREERYEAPIWQRFPELAAVELDITLESESGFKIENEVAGAAVDLELEFNNLKLGGTLRDLQPNGVVNIADGRVTFRQTRFEVLPGAQLRFNETLDAFVDVSAQAEINTQSTFASRITGGTTRDRRRISTSDLAQTDLYIITLSLTGPLSQLTPEFESTPNLTDNNIYTLLLTGQTLESLRGESEEDPTFDIAFGSLLAPFFESQVDEILSADQFKFQFAEGAAQFSYIQQVNKALRVAAGVSIRGAEGNESAIAGEYRFDDNFLLELIGQNTVEEEGKAPQFSVGGRLEWRIPLD